MKFKKIMIMLLAAVMVLSFAVSCKKTDTSKDNSGDETKAEETKKEYERGESSAEGWKSEYLGLKFTPDESMVMATAEEVDKMMELGADAILGEDNGKKIYDFSKITVVYEMMAVSATGDNVIVMAEKPLLSNTTLEQYLDGFKKQTGGLISDSIEFSEPVDYTLGGQTFKKVEMSYSFSGVNISQIYLVKKQNDRFVGVIFTEMTEGSFDKIAAMFSEI
ncbi:MAG: hypothetical protein IJD37_04250 [Clostridia bacterium]|nr:hypothetical protein [Clostridia bacterium]